MMRSVWINGCEGRYKIYDDGRVESFCKGKQFFLKPYIVDKKENYLVVRLYLDQQSGPQKNRRVHRLVAEHFVPGGKPGLEVNHVNGNKQDNRAENLEWVTCKENIHHAFKAGLRPSMSIPVKGTNIKTGEEVFFESMTEAARKTGTDSNSIHKCCRGKRRRTAAGYTWTVAGPT